MEISSEISQKIRSAIKAKLLELGAYVDDELPEYIMVMVANKRSRPQMNADLCLFLGAHTSGFTEWLHGLLGKLQTIKADTDKSTNKQEKAKLKVKNKSKAQIGKTDKKVSTSNEKNRKDISNTDGITKKKITNANDRKSNEVKNLHACDDIKDIERNNDKEKQYQDTENIGKIARTEELGDAEFETAESEFSKSKAESLTCSSVSEKSYIDSSGVNQVLNQEQQFESTALNRKRKAPCSGLPDGSVDEDACSIGVDTVLNIDKYTEFNSNAPTSLQINRQTDSSASLENTKEHQDEKEGPTPQKMIKLSETVHLDDIKQALAEVLERNHLYNDDIAHFSRMIESSLRKLRHHDLSLAKLRIQQVLCEFESSAVEGLDRVRFGENISHVAYTSKNLKTCLDYSQDVLTTHSELQNATSLSVDSSGDRHKLVTSLRGADKPLLAKEGNTDFNIKINDLVDLDEHVDDMRANRMQIKSTMNSVAMKNNSLKSDTRDSLHSDEPHVGRVIFHHESKSSLNEHRSKTPDTIVRTEEIDRTLVKSPKWDGHSPQSHGSLTKANIGSPSSVHSCPLSSTSEVCVLKHRTSPSRECTIYPLDLHAKPSGSIKFKSASSKSKPSPAILVDSIHNKKRLEPAAECTSVLSQNWQRNKSPRSTSTSKSDSQDSPRQYGPEALKVMAKNLRITVINKRAVRPQQESSSDDSEDEEEDSTDEESGDEDEKTNSAKTKKSEEKSHENIQN